MAGANLSREQTRSDLTRTGPEWDYQLEAIANG
jgi:hypothetical protein